MNFSHNCENLDLEWAIILSFVTKLALREWKSNVFFINIDFYLKQKT